MSSTGTLDTQRIGIDRFWHFARQVMLIGIVLHGVIGLASWFAGAVPLLAAQAVMIVLYCVGYLATTRRNRWLVIALALLDLLGHSTIACLIVGVDSGFQYYTWIVLPLLFANIRRKLEVKVAIAIVLIAGYVALDWWLRRTSPLIVISPEAFAGLRYFNIGCYLLALGVISATHIKTVNAAERRLSAMASTDALTGLLNRHRMSGHLQQELLRARDAGSSLAVVLLDIDHFKAINDHFGHGRGDQVISQLGAVLRAAVRREDWVARWGGEEFLVLLPGSDTKTALDTAERIREAVSLEIVRDESDTVPVTITIGVAVWNNRESLERTIDRADVALYRGKRAGRNRVELAGEHEPSHDELLQDAG